MSLMLGTSIKAKTVCVWGQVGQKLVCREMTTWEMDCEGNRVCEGNAGREGVGGEQSRGLSTGSWVSGCPAALL